MIMQDKKKDVIAAILSKKAGQESVEAAPKSEDGAMLDSSVGYESAADEMMRAFEAKDPKALVEALKSFVEMCSSEQHEEPADFSQPE